MRGESPSMVSGVSQGHRVRWLEGDAAPLHHLARSPTRLGEARGAVEADSFRAWPNYLPGPRDNIFALGVISLMYGSLEWMFASVFQAVTQVPWTVMVVLFPKLQNDARLAVIDDVLAK